MNSGGLLAGSALTFDIDDVSNWIKESEDEVANSDTRRLNANETEEIELNGETHIGPFPILTPATANPSTAAPQPTAQTPARYEPETPEPPKVSPPPPKSSHKDSGSAASDVLNKFFKRR